jgi:hypothetical protein
MYTMRCIQSFARPQIYVARPIESDAQQMTEPGESVLRRHSKLLAICDKARRIVCLMLVAGRG